MPAKAYRQSAKIRELQHKTYADIDQMIGVKTQKYRQFNGPDGDRTWQEYVDDGDRRVNGYTPTREEQGKEDWQENFFDQFTRSKLRALVASVALQVPEFEWKAVNNKGIYSATRAQLIKELVRFTQQADKPQMNIFWEAWECAGKGTVIKYDGYIKTKIKRKIITNYDVVTGEVEWKEKEEVINDRPVDLFVSISEFYPWDMGKHDVQDQPKVAWIKNYDEQELEFEFGHYPNFIYVKDKKQVERFNTSKELYFYESWKGRVKEEDDYEVVKFYDQLTDSYQIWCNGLDFLIAPLVWGRGRKRYPFSKTIFEPFDGRNFFAGKSLPHVLEGNQDLRNALMNSMADKEYRSLAKPLLVGLANKDLLDVEDELVNQDNKIYVPDINQVKELPFEGVTAGDVQMLNIVSRMGDITYLDQNQQGVQGRGVTAREILIADENARKVKGIFFTFLEDLWHQKTTNRVTNVLMNMMQPKMEAVIGKEGAETLKEALTLYNISDVTFSDGTKGTLGVQIVGDKKSLPAVGEIEATENAMEEQGINYKRIALTSDYLDDWELDFKIIPSSLEAKEQAKKAAVFEEKITTEATFFPEYLAANKERRYKDFLDMHGESIEDFNPPAPPPTAVAPDGSAIPDSLLPPEPTQ